LSSVTVDVYAMMSTPTAVPVSVAVRMPTAPRAEGTAPNTSIVAK
jgi:hypothetical protein